MNRLATCSSFSLDSNTTCLNYFSNVNLKPFTVTVSLMRTPTSAIIKSTLGRLVQTVVLGRCCYPIIRNYSGISNTNRILKAICKNRFVVMIEFTFNETTREYWVLSITQIFHSNSKVKWWFLAVLKELTSVESRSSIYLWSLLVKSEKHLVKIWWQKATFSVKQLNSACLCFTFV